MTNDMTLERMSKNQQAIAEHVRDNLIIDENINEDGTINWNFVEADICMDIAEGKLDAEENFDDMDVVFGAFASAEELFELACAAIRRARRDAK